MAAKGSLERAAWCGWVEVVEWTQVVVEVCQRQAGCGAKGKELVLVLEKLKDSTWMVGLDEK